ncbi:hypothetical protein GVAV_003461 [Gurleya vavrai]
MKNLPADIISQPFFKNLKSYSVFKKRSPNIFSLFKPEPIYNWSFELVNKNFYLKGLVKGIEINEIIYDVENYFVMYCSDKIYELVGEMDRNCVFEMFKNGLMSNWRDVIENFSNQNELSDENHTIDIEKENDNCSIDFEKENQKIDFEKEKNNCSIDLENEKNHTYDTKKENNNFSIDLESEKNVNAFDTKKEKNFFDLEKELAKYIQKNNNLNSYSNEQKTLKNFNHIYENTEHQPIFKSLIKENYIDLKPSSKILEINKNERIKDNELKKENNNYKENSLILDRVDIKNLEKNNFKNQNIKDKSILSGSILNDFNNSNLEPINNYIGINGNEKNLKLNDNFDFSYNQSFSKNIIIDEDENKESGIPKPKIFYQRKQSSKKYVPKPIVNDKKERKTVKDFINNNTIFSKKDISYDKSSSLLKINKSTKRDINSTNLNEKNLFYKSNILKISSCESDDLKIVSQNIKDENRKIADDEKVLNEVDKNIFDDNNINYVRIEKLKDFKNCFDNEMIKFDINQDTNTTEIVKTNNLIRKNSNYNDVDTPVNNYTKNIDKNILIFDKLKKDDSFKNTELNDKFKFSADKIQSFVIKDENLDIIKKQIKMKNKKNETTHEFDYKTNQNSFDQEVSNKKEDLIPFSEFNSDKNSIHDIKNIYKDKKMVNNYDVKTDKINIKNTEKNKFCGFSETKNFLDSKFDLSKETFDIQKEFEKYIQENNLIQENNKSKKKKSTNDDKTNEFKKTRKSVDKKLSNQNDSYKKNLNEKNFDSVQLKTLNLNPDLHENKSLIDKFETQKGENIYQKNFKNKIDSSLNNKFMDKTQNALKFFNNPVNRTFSTFEELQKTKNEDINKNQFLDSENYIKPNFNENITKLDDNKKIDFFNMPDFNDLFNKNDSKSLITDWKTINDTENLLSKQDKSMNDDQPNLKNVKSFDECNIQDLLTSEESSCKNIKEETSNLSINISDSDSFEKNTLESSKKNTDIIFDDDKIKNDNLNNNDINLSKENLIKKNSPLHIKKNKEFDFDSYNKKLKKNKINKDSDSNTIKNTEKDDNSSMINLPEIDQNKPSEILIQKKFLTNENLGDKPDINISDDIEEDNKDENSIENLDDNKKTLILVDKNEIDVLNKNISKKPISKNKNENSIKQKMEARRKSLNIIKDLVKNNQKRRVSEGNEMLTTKKIKAQSEDLQKEKEKISKKALSDEKLNLVPKKISLVNNKIKKENSFTSGSSLNESLQSKKTSLKRKKSFVMPKNFK